jgi:hypothetical protein
MKTYFVAKTANSGFLGLYQGEQILSMLNKGDLVNDYVFTESFGPSYSEILKLKNIVWKPLTHINIESAEAQIEKQNKSAPIISEIANSPGLVYWTIILIAGILYALMRNCHR